MRSRWLLIRNEVLNAFYNSSHTASFEISFSKHLSVEILQISEKIKRRDLKTSIISRVHVRSWWIFISNEALHVHYNTSHTIVSIWCLLSNAFLNWSPFKHWKKRKFWKWKKLRKWTALLSLEVKRDIAKFNFDNLHKSSSLRHSRNLKTQNLIHSSRVARGFA